MILTYKYRIKDRSAKKVLRIQARACNAVWNWCAGYQRDIEARYRAGAPSSRWPSHFDLSKSGLGGWAEGLEAEGYDVIRVDIEDMFAARVQGARCKVFKRSEAAAAEADVCALYVSGLTLKDTAAKSNLCASTVSKILPVLWRKRQKGGDG